MGQPEGSESPGSLWKDDANSFTCTWWQILILCQLVKLHWFPRVWPGTCFWRHAAAPPGRPCWAVQAGRLQRGSVCSLSVSHSLKAPTHFFVLIRIYFDCMTATDFQMLRASGCGGGGRLVLCRSVKARSGGSNALLRLLMQKVLAPVDLCRRVAVCLYPSYEWQ